MYKVVYTRQAVKAIRKMPINIKQQIQKACVKLAYDPEAGKKLSADLEGCRSLRTGNYRIIYEIRKKQILIIVLAIGHRREVYKKMSKRN